MRMRLLALLALLALSGCGVLDDAGPATQATPDPAVYGPSHATGNESPSSSELPPPPSTTPSPQVASELDAGQVGVVDMGGAIGVKPASLDTSSDLTVSKLQWSAWDASGAEGEGTLRMPTCQPTCAGGATIELQAQVELSGLKTCDGRRYFDHAEVRIDPKVAPDGLQPASYLRAPC
jgi:hypothetical protein